MRGVGEDVANQVLKPFFLNVWNLNPCLLKVMLDLFLLLR